MIGLRPGVLTIRHHRRARIPMAGGHRHLLLRLRRIISARHHLRRRLLAQMTMRIVGNRAVQNAITARVMRHLRHHRVGGKAISGWNCRNPIRAFSLQSISGILRLCARALCSSCAQNK